ncbi:polyprenyl synthetase family protein [Fictibacillus sp. KU28468]|uniref:polyprenyl synthetase family protein n=1 Tax=Fictibacillus sp. KU28468 TaxID=2991053 RepID=UPI00223D1F12|nr:farnesyl diphosphate synthase [Fictibacillus sp. KU28468]UZJ80704.1 polyprenyl synthetase family protein [Fictibacillus sp. KU28468]
MDIQHYLQGKRQLINDHLPSFLAEKSIPSLLKDSMLYSLQAGGKRLRPILTLAVLDAFGKNSEAGIEAACALEMVHTYSLIHDDLPCMDDDDYRRGKPTNHKTFGEATAILAGDALLTFSFQMIAGSSTYTPEQKVALLTILSEASGAEGMVAGQAVDMESENQELTIEELQSIHERKTGRLLEASVLFGAVLADADAEEFEHLGVFSRHLGIAFQIQDDILDVTGDSQLMGKQAGSDEHNYKSTYPKLLTLEGAKEQLAHHIKLAKDNLRKTKVDPVILEGITDYIVSRNH